MEAAQALSACTLNTHVTVFVFKREGRPALRHLRAEEEPSSALALAGAGDQRGGVWWAGLRSSLLGVRVSHDVFYMTPSPGAGPHGGAQWVSSLHLCDAA